MAVKDHNKKPAFDSHMKKYNRGLPPEEKIKILNEGVKLRQAVRPSRDKVNDVNV